MDIQINHRQYQAARVKGPGNAYLTKKHHELGQGEQLHPAEPEQRRTL